MSAQSNSSPTTCIMFFLKVLILVSGATASPLFQGRKMVDLSHGYDETTLFWPGADPFHFTKRVEELVNGTSYRFNNFATGEHIGTHIDAPIHFSKTGIPLGQMPLNKFFVNGVVVNVSSEVNGNPEYVMGTGPLEAWEAAHGPMPDNSVVLVVFGWAARWPNKEAYLGPSDTVLRFPGINRQAAEWLNNKEAVVGVGVDTVSPDVVGDQTFPVHVTLLGNAKYILENVNTPEPMPHLVQLVVLPIKITNGTGGPTRVIALL